MIQRTLLFTDVVDSTRLVERIGDEQAATIWAEHDRRARRLLAEHGGTEIDRSDGFFLLFEQAADAARYALAYHRELAALALSARVGIHTGAVTLRDNAAEDVARGAKRVEVEGLAKPFAARVMSLAQGGQTLLSDEARQALESALTAGCVFEPHGHYRLKGIEEPRALFELGDEACVFAPPADTDKAYRVVRTGDLWQPLREVRHNLAPERDAFIGRAELLRELARRFDAGVRLLNLVGPGGTGKTRLARRYGRAWLGDWPGGVYFCDLSEARSLEGIVFAVASALGVPLGKDEPTLQLGNAIAARGRCLVMLDNFEQVVQHAAATLGRWIDRATDAAFLVTSRERLQLGGEDVFAVDPLPLATDAVDLFVVRARAQQPGFMLDEGSAVAEVVQLLDGLPLAIELAAARVRVLSPRQIVLRLKDRFQLLAGARGAAARQATLKAAIDWSWDLLTPWEQAALAQCSVYEGGFTLEAAEGVLDLAAWPEAASVMDAVQALVDKSLLRAWLPKEGARLDIDEPYFGMYLSIHEYAADKLRASGQALATQHRHGRAFARLGSDEAIESLAHHGGVKRRHALALETDNLVAACRRAVQRGDVEVAVAAYRAAWEVFELRGPYEPGRALGELVLALAQAPDGLRARVLLTLGRVHIRLSNFDAARKWLGEASELSASLADEGCELEALGALARLLHEHGRVDEADTLFEAIVARLRAPHRRRLLGSVLGNVAILRHEQSRVDEAKAHYQQAIAIHREVGDRRGEGNGVSNLGALEMQQGRFAESAMRFDEAIVIQRDVGNLVGQGHAVHNLGLLATDRGQFDQARQHFDDAMRMYRDAGSRRFEAQALGNLGLACHRQMRLDEARRHLDAALAIHRDIGNRRFEAITRGHLGVLDGDEGKLQSARDHLEQAAAMFLAMGDPRFRAMAHRDLATLCFRNGQIGEATSLLDAAEPALREVDDRVELAVLLCLRGRMKMRHGDLERARAHLAEAESAALANHVGPESELGRAIAELRAVLA